MKGKKPYNTVDITGRRFSYLTVIKRVGNFVYFNSKGQRKQKSRYLCKCDCGKEFVRQYSSIVGKGAKIKSCGCKKAEILAFKNRNKRILNSPAKSLMARYKVGARKRGLSFSLSLSEFSKITSMNCNYCGVAPFQISKGHWNDYEYNGIDRLDSSKGYYLDNCVPCCGNCNLMKLDMSYIDFMRICMRIVLKYKGDARYKKIKDSRKSAYRRRYGKPRKVKIEKNSNL